jgi:galactokinase
MNNLKKFQQRFGGPCRLFRAPGRVNLIGEHTDYNDGYVMPAAIDFACSVAIGPRADRKLSIYSENMNESFEADLANPDLRASGGWSDYPLGVAVTLERAGYSQRGANLYILSHVPIGAGLSSSAAIEVSTGFACLQVSGYKIDPVQLALICQRAENEFVGARCGIMDQFTACHGHAGQAIMLDADRSLPGADNSREDRPHRLQYHGEAPTGGGGIQHTPAECERCAASLARIAADPPLRDLTSQRLETNAIA